GLVEHPGRPWAGWPPPYRGLAAGWYYLVLATALVAAVGLGWLVATGWRRCAGDAPTSRARSHSTAWARSRELRPLTVRSSLPGRVTLGRTAAGVSGGRRYLAAEPRQSVIVVGPTQTQKTTGFAVPALL